MVTSLHTHSRYSVLDGLSNIPQLVKRAKELGMESLALTDHGTISGAIEFYQECQKQDIKPILGSEVYLVEDLQKARDEKQRHSYHLVLLAENDIGWSNICKITTLANQNYYYKPRVDLDILRQHKEGIIVLTACLHGFVTYHLFDHIKKELNADGQEVSLLKDPANISKAYEHVKSLKEIFGINHLFLEVQDATLPEQKLCNPRIRKLAEDLGLKTVATQDAHYVLKEDAESHTILKAIAFGQSAIDSSGNGFGAPEFYLKTKSEWLDNNSTLLEEEVDRTNEIAARCNVKLELGKPRLPRFPLIDNQSAIDILRSKSSKRLKELGVSKVYQDRLNKELSIIEGAGIADYFLLVEDVISWAKSQNILINNARGSVGGSLLAFLLGITSVDPIKYNLIFERFYSVDRKDLPDIDLDFAKDRRDEVIQFIKNKYGQDRVAQLVTFSTLAARAVLKDVFRVAGIDFDTSNCITDLVPAKSEEHGAIELADAIRLNPKLAEYANNDQEFDILKDGKILRRTSYKKLFDIALKLEGSIRGVGKHAAAVIILDKSFMDSDIPLIKPAGDDDLIVGYDMESVDKLGLLKLDILGLTTLSVVNTALGLIEKRHHIKLNMHTLPLDDKKTYQFLSEGRTEGVFQLETSLGKSWAKKVKPQNISEIADLISLIRPSVLDLGLADEYIKVKHKEKEPYYLDPTLKPILQKTHGVCVYQEQLMEICHKIAGLTLVESNVVRRAVGKKKPEELKKWKERFVVGATKTIGQDKAEKVWEWLEAAGGYGFCAAHGVGYGLLAYQTAYLKANYPVEFICANLIHAKDKANQQQTPQDVIAKFINDAKLYDINIVPPSLEYKNIYFEIMNNSTIAFGLSSIKNVGASACEKLKHLQKLNSLEELLLTAKTLKLNKQVVVALISCGVLDYLKAPRKLMLQQFELINELSTKEYEAWTKNPINILKFIEWLTTLTRDELKQKIGMAPNKNRVEKLKELLVKFQNIPSQDSIAQILSWEEEYLGIAISGDLADLRDQNSNMTCIELTKPSIDKKQQIRLCVTLQEIKEITVKRGKSAGKPMAFLKVSDSTYTLDNVVMFTETYLKYKNLINVGDVVVLKGKISDKGSLMINILQKI